MLYVYFKSGVKGFITWSFLIIALVLAHLKSPLMVSHPQPFYLDWWVAPFVCVIMALLINHLQYAWQYALYFIWPIFLLNTTVQGSYREYLVLGYYFMYGSVLILLVMSVLLTSTHPDNLTRRVRTLEARLGDIVGMDPRAT